MRLALEVSFEVTDRTAGVGQKLTFASDSFKVG